MGRYHRDGRRKVVYEEALERLRGLCLSWPFTSEASSWGNPTFMFNGKAFAVLDQYKGADCIWVRCDKRKREPLLKRVGFFTTPYDTIGIGICRKVEQLCWDEMAGLLRESYESLIV